LVETCEIDFLYPVSYPTSILLCSSRALRWDFDFPHDWPMAVFASLIERVTVFVKFLKCYGILLL